MKHPLVVVALYASGLLLAEWFRPPLVLLYGLSFLALLLALLLPKLRPRLIGPLLVLVGWTNLVSHTAIVSPNDLRQLLGSDPALATVRATLVDRPSLKAHERDGEEFGRSLARDRMREVRLGDHWQPATGTILATPPGAVPEGFFAGRPAEISGVLALPPWPVAEGLFDYRNYLRRQESTINSRRTRLTTEDCSPAVARRH